MVELFKSIWTIKTRNPNERILDMGAANIPHPISTHAVDSGSKKITLSCNFSNKNDYVNGYITKPTFERMLERMDYRFNFNYNTTKLPWPDNFFDVVYSNGSIGRYGKPYAYKEAYRVLKRGGRLDFSTGGTKERIQKLFDMLQGIGYKQAGTDEFGSYMYNGKQQYGGHIIAIK
jgi:SAM-dependent methyltransferase